MGSVYQKVILAGLYSQAVLREMKKRGNNNT